MSLRTFNHSRPDLTPYGFTCELWKGAVMRRPDRHNEIELNLILRGALTYLIGGQRVTLSENCLGAFWATLPHQIIGSEGNPQYYVVTLPLAWFLQCQLPAPLVDRLLAGQFLRESVGHRLELDTALFRQWERDLRGAHSEPGPAVKLELHARMLRLATTLPVTAAIRANSRAVAGEALATKAEQMASYIARHYQEPMSANDVAGHVGLHPNYAMTLFKQTFRTTLNEYLTHYRIAQSQRLLATTGEKVIDIAFAAGFRTASRFYDAFRKSCGCSPSQYRRAFVVAHEAAGAHEPTAGAFDDGKSALGRAEEPVAKWRWGSRGKLRGISKLRQRVTAPPAATKSSHGKR